MTSYKYFKREIISDFSSESISRMYSNGFVFGRIEKGQMDQVVSLRINLKDFELTSENRRVMRKVEWMNLETQNLPIEIDEYDFRIHKLGKDFYAKKNNSKVFSATKIKELVTSKEKSNFNILMKFRDEHKNPVGYAICYENKDILHYAYPFYDLDIKLPNVGMGMILNTIQYAKNNKKEYFYLGSVNTPKNLYKLQFNNSQWWNGKKWSEDIEELKNKIKQSNLIPN